MNSVTTSVSEQNSIIEAAVTKTDDNIGKLLQDAGKLKPQDMERVLKLQQEQNLRFGEAALKLGLVNEADIRQALSQQFEYPYIPESEASLSPELTAATAPTSKEAEALRSVRSELLLRWFRDGRKTLAVGSARADEGSSYLAANLAVLFAQMSRKVLLIDANMRQPRQHDIFNLGNSMGLSDILAERVPSLQDVPGGLLGRFAAVKHGTDVVRRGGDHGFDHVAGLRRAGRHRSGFDRRDGDAHAHRIHVGELRVALEGVDRDEAARVGEPLDAEHRVDALERRQHHRVGKRQFVLLDDLALVVVLGDKHLAGFDLGDLGVADPLDVAVAQGGFEQSLGIADAAEAQMADIRLGSDEGHRYAVADLAVLQVGIHDHCVFIRRAVAGSPLHRAHHDGPRVLHELVPRTARIHRMVHSADRLCMAFRPQPRHFIKRQLGPGRDDQEIVVNGPAVGEFDLVLLRVHARRANRSEERRVGKECRSRWSPYH